MLNGVSGYSLIRTLKTRNRAEFTWPDNSAASSQTEAVKFLVFTFYNSELCRIFVIYDRNRTQGLSADDFIDSISTVFGNPTRPAASIRTGSSVLYGFGDEEKMIARWQDLRSSVNLIRSSYDELEARGWPCARGNDRRGQTRGRGASAERY